VSDVSIELVSEPTNELVSERTSDEPRWHAEDDPALLASDWRAVLPRRIAELAASFPDRPFMTDVEGRSLTYGAFESELRRWCALLRQLGVHAGDRVASLLPSSIDAHLVWFACSRLGALEVSVNRELRGEFMSHVLNDSGAQLCFVRPEDVNLPADAGVATLNVVVVDRVSGLVGSVYGDDELALLSDHESGGSLVVEPADVACVIYTSGTTGPAKGVLVTWGQLSTAVGRLPRSWLSSEDAYYSPWPMFHVSGRTGAITMADVGGRVVCRQRASVSEFWPDVREHRCTFSVVSPIVALLLAQPASPDDQRHPLRWVYAGGTTAVDFQRRFGVRALTSFGSTEMGFVAVKRWADEATAGHVGWLRPGYQARLTDDAGNEVPDGTAGELWVKPPLPHMITPGYLGQPAWTAKAITDGWYRTGDSLVRQTDGSLRFVDRLGDTIRRFGENISAVAVETAILREPDILRCGIVGVPAAVSGAEVLLAVVSTTDVVLDASELYARLQTILPRHALPAFIAIVDELPLTANGKLRRHELISLAQNPMTWRLPVAEK
jgi:carnitine-CoA ligase